MLIEIVMVLLYTFMFAAEFLHTLPHIKKKYETLTDAMYLATAITALVWPLGLSIRIVSKFFNLFYKN
jgi:hypothetical protein